MATPTEVDKQAAKRVIDDWFNESKVQGIGWDALMTAGIADAIAQARAEGRREGIEAAVMELDTMNAYSYLIEGVRALLPPQEPDNA